MVQLLRGLALRVELPPELRADALAGTWWAGFVVGWLCLLSVVVLVLVIRAEVRR